MFAQIFGDDAFFRGSLKSYPIKVLYEEITFLAYYLHWPHKEITELSHKERIRYCGEVSNINKKMNGEESKKNIFDIGL
jgi:hypothetical protein